VRLLRARYPDHPDVAHLLAQQRVLVDGRIITNPRATVRRDAAGRVLPERQLRGDIKLTTALAAFDIDVSGVVAVDVGAAAGGFTTALLSAGARRVYAVDTGYGQLLGSLRGDPRVVNLERTNVADLNGRIVPDAVGVVTVDLTYTPLAKAIGGLDALTLASPARLLALVKPTFELAAPRLVVDRRSVDTAIASAIRSIDRGGWIGEATTLPAATGRNGAIEAFILATRSPLAR
jgi:23S rRNA (cytidine1920-2'-O)/16S rRNA (cytidine1409-2'-O)-methyltransferase